MIAPSSIIQPIPITIGPAIANIVALGWTIVPGTRRFREKEAWKFGHTRSYGDITFEFNILTNYGFWMKCELVASAKRSKLLIRIPRKGILNTLAASKAKRLFVLDWQTLNRNAHQNGEVAMDCRIGDNYNMQVRLHFFPNESCANLIKYFT